MIKQANLDRLCAKYGQKIVTEGKNLFKNNKEFDKNKIKNPIQKSLGVLQEDGVYAFFLYLDSEGAFDKDKTEKVISEHSWEILKEDNINLVTKNFDKEKVYKELQENVLKELDKMFLAKNLLEKMLIYARYHAKALPENLEK